MEAAAGAELVVVELEELDGEAIAALPDLRLVATARGAPSNVDVSTATARGLPVLHTPGRNAASVADFTIGLILVQCRSIARGQDHLRRRGWMVGDQLPYLHFRGPELAGRTLGLVGYGAVGRQVARRAASGFGMQVLAYDPFVSDPAPPARAATLDELLSASDVVSLHCPLTPDTVGLLGGRELALMQPHAVLVNTARAPVVDEAALVEALATGRIGGAALDVFWSEPVAPDHPLFGFDSVTLTPHLAGAADDVVTHHTRMIVDDVARWLAGERPVHLANPEVWG